MSSDSARRPGASGGGVDGPSPPDAPPASDRDRFLARAVEAFRYAAAGLEPLNLPHETTTPLTFAPGHAPARGVPPSPETLGVIFGTLIRLYAFKNPLYGSSWCKRGTVSTFENVARKYDRMENLVVEQHQDPGMDDMMDLTNYSGMQTAYQAEHRPEAYHAWRRRVAEELAALGAPGF